MKESKVTGRFIYDQIKKLEIEFDELVKACDQIDDELGRDTIAYRLLIDACDDKKKELNRYLTAEYNPYIAGIVSFGKGSNVF